MQQQPSRARPETLMIPQYGRLIFKPVWRAIFQTQSAQPGPPAVPQISPQGLAYMSRLEVCPVRGLTWQGGIVLVMASLEPPSLSWPSRERVTSVFFFLARNLIFCYCSVGHWVFFPQFHVNRNTRCHSSFVLFWFFHFPSSPAVALMILLRSRHPAEPLRGLSTRRHPT